MNEHFVEILKGLGFDDNIANNISDGIREKYLTIDKWHVYDDTVFCLKSAIEKGYFNIIFSNHVPELEELLEKLEIRDYFIKIYSSAYIGYEKPNIKAFKKVFMDLKDVERV